MLSVFTLNILVLEHDQDILINLVRARLVVWMKTPLVRGARTKQAKHQLVQPVRRVRVAWPVLAQVNPLVLESQANISTTAGEELVSDTDSDWTVPYV